MNLQDKLSIELKMFPRKLLLFVSFITCLVIVRGACNPPYKAVGPDDLCIFVINKNLPVSWAEARLVCQEIGGDLLILTKHTQIMDISKHIDADSQAQALLSRSYWIGAHKADSVWQWIDNTPVNLASNMWLPYQPLPAVPGPQYAILVPTGFMYGRRYLSSSGVLAVESGIICQSA